MEHRTILVITDPPHGDVNDDAAAVIMGLPPAEARPKISFGAPEVIAATNPDRAVDIAESLIATGLNVAVRDAKELGSVPWPTLASSYALGSRALVARTGDGEVTLPYDEPAFAVAFQPPPDFPAPPNSHGILPLKGIEAADALEWIPHIDLYFLARGRLARVAIVPGSGDGSPEGDTVGHGEVAPLLKELGRRFAHLAVDTRLEGVRPRRRFVAGETGFDPDLRKRYAYGTLLLRHLLEEISPDLRDATHYEVGSRMAYVLQPARGSVRLG